MATYPEHSQALDQLQREVNFVLEQTGRIFKSAHESNRSATLARASRLKQTLPVANGRFHETLDTLEEELQFARAVLRRDLAVAREKDGKQTGTAVPTLATATAQPAKESAKPETVRQVSPPPAEVPEPPAPKKDPAGPPKAQAELKVEQPKSPKKRPSPQPDDEPAAKRQAVGEDKPTKVEANLPEAKPSETPLQIDTQPADESKDPQPSEEKPPDTGTLSNTGDLDSLFNDAASVGGTGTGDSGGEQNTSTGPDTGLDFDFATFNAGLEANNTNNDNDNDNISALLPGLQDYANNSAGGEPDFSAFFANDPLTGGGGGGDAQNGTGDSQQQRDTTFDDLMGDLTFTMDGDGNDGGNDIFDFS